MDEKYLKIKNTPLFKGTGNIEKVLETGLLKKYRTGESIDVTNKLAYVAEGSVLVYSLEKQRNLLLRRIDSGEMFGIASVLSDGLPVSRAVSKGVTELLFLDAATVRNLLETDKTFMYNYISFLSDRVNFLNKKITYITAGSSDRKLALYLSMFETDSVTLDTSLTALSDMLDIGRASIYRSLEKLEKDGCISRFGNKIIISDRDLMIKNYLKEK